MSDGYLLREEGERKYFAMIPNLIDDIGLSQKAYRLYGHIKRVTGESGRYLEGVDAMAKHCQMSKPTAIKAKRELEEHGLIKVVPGKDRTSPDELVILDVWDRNTGHFDAVKNEERGKEYTRVEVKNEERDAVKNRERKKSSKEDIKEEEEGGSVSYLLNDTSRRIVQALLSIKNWDKNEADTVDLVTKSVKTYGSEHVLTTATNLSFKLDVGVVAYKKPSKAFANWLTRESPDKPKAPGRIRSKEIEPDDEWLLNYYATMPEGLKR